MSGEQATLTDGIDEDQARLPTDMDCPRGAEYCEGPGAPDDIERKCSGCWIHGWRGVDDELVPDDLDVDDGEVKGQ